METVFCRSYISIKNKSCRKFCICNCSPTCCWLSIAKRYCIVYLFNIFCFNISTYCIRLSCIYNFSIIFWSCNFQNRSCIIYYKQRFLITVKAGIIIYINLYSYLSFLYIVYTTCTILSKACLRKVKARNCKDMIMVDIFCSDNNWRSCCICTLSYIGI